MTNWSPKQIKHYRKLTDATLSRSLRDTAALCFDECQFLDPIPPAAITAAEKALRCALPDDLKQLYLETDGISAPPLVMPLQTAVQENKTLRRSPDLRDLYMPFDHMLVFGGSGNGDLFFFPIRTDGSLAPNVFIWDHESDSRTYFANSLKDLFLRYATNHL